MAGSAWTVPAISWGQAVIARKRSEDTSAWQAPMSVALGLGLGFFVLTAVAGVLGVGLVSGFQNTAQLLGQKAELLVSSEINQMQSFLDAAENQVDFVAEQIVRGEVEPGSDEDFTSMMLGALAATPQIVALQFISTDYELTGAERQDFESVPLFKSVAGESELKQLVDEIRVGLSPTWGSLLWRGEYGQALLNYSRPVVRDGRFLGIISALVSPMLLSELISDLETDFGANAFVLYGRDMVLAHPLMAFGYPGLTRLNPLPARSKYSDPVLMGLWQETTSSRLERLFLSGPDVSYVPLGETVYAVLHKEVHGYSDRPLLVGTYFKSQDFLSEAIRLRWAIVISLAISMLAALTAGYLGRQIARPVRRLAEGARKVHYLDLDSVERIPHSRFREINDAAGSFNAMLSGLRWFERYVPKSIVMRLIRLHENAVIESEHRDVAILFTDIVGFTTLTEKMTASTSADFLNQHFTMIAECIEATGGTVDKYIGDSVMAMWGAPERQEDMADRAFQAALAIAHALRESNRARAAEGLPIIRLRLGLHVGRVVVGNIGSPGRIEYTVVGDAVNVAQRLEESGKVHGQAGSETNILVSGPSRSALVSDHFDLDHLGPLTLRGRKEQVEVYVLRHGSSG